jgi:hypothetical protein
MKKFRLLKGESLWNTLIMYGGLEKIMPQIGFQKFSTRKLIHFKSLKI